MSKSVTKNKIPIGQLSIGMLVTGVDRPWYATPFLSHRMLITTESEIATLKACGVKLVEVEVEHADAHTPGAATSSASPPPLSGHQLAVAPARVSTSAGSTAPSAAAPGEPNTSGEAAKVQPAAAEAEEGPTSSFEEEIHAALTAYHQARAAVARALQDAKMGRGLSVEGVSASVRAMADSIIRNPHALSSLSRLKSLDEYTYYHSVNTCVLAMALGRQMNMGRQPLSQLGLGVLLHDIGKTQVPADLLTKQGRLTDSETEAIKQHVMRGVDYLSGTLHLGAEVLLPVLEHHERMNGTGYPHHRKRAELSEVGLIAGVVDVYDALTSDRPYRKAVSPHQALQVLYDMARRGELDSACVERFIRFMGIYPVGSCVRLSSGEVGVVSKVNPTQTLNPMVVVVKETPTGALVAPRLLDLSVQSEKAVKRIAEVLQPTTVGIVPNDILDATLAELSSARS